MIFCPKRLSEIAVMRCGEYQMRDGCGFGCKQKASVDAIVEARAAMRVDEDRPSPLNCAMCGAAKETDKGRYCRRCRSLAAIRGRARAKSRGTIRRGRAISIR